MIPLRTTEPVQKFPWWSLGAAGFWIVAEIALRLQLGTRLEALTRMAFVPRAPSFETAISSSLFQLNGWAVGVAFVFTWVFTPRLIERHGRVFLAGCGLSAVALAAWSYSAIHSDSQAPVLLADAWVGAWLGAFMRRDIWGSVDAFVIGPGFARVLEVPSYVLLFFWFFYLLVGNLLTTPPFADAPMPYWIAFISFLWGFVLESLWDILKRRWMSSS